MDKATTNGVHGTIVDSRIRNLIESTGGVPIGSFRQSNRKWYKFLCERGHERKRAVYYGIVSRIGPCRQCERDDQLAAVHKIAKEKNGRCLTVSLARLRTPVELECEQGHRWKNRATYVLQGKWCSECDGTVRRRVTIEKAKSIAAERGGECLSKELSSSRDDRLSWRCSEGHSWQATYHGVGHEGSWCPTCARKSRRIGIKQAHALAQRHGGKCLSDTCRDSREVLRWQCKNGHEWRLCYSALKTRGRFCLRCEPLSRRVRSEEEMLVWACEEAERRGGHCLSKKYDRREPYLEWECANGHRWVASCEEAIRRGSWCSECRETPHVDRRVSKSHIALRARMFDEAKEIAKDRGGKCLSTSYINNQAPLKWRCGEGHEWEAGFANVKQRGSWCPVCSRVRGSLKRLKAIADEAGGVLLSTEYKGAYHAYEWRCKSGHEFVRRLDAARGNFCIECREASLMIKRAKGCAEKRGGRFCSHQWAGPHGDHDWQCSAGHRFTESYDRVRSMGAWCPECGEGVGE